MLFRTVLLLTLCGAFLAAVVWLLPIEGILSARGYSKAEITALKEAAAERRAASQGRRNPLAANPGEPGSAAGVKPARPATTSRDETEAQPGVGREQREQTGQQRNQDSVPRDTRESLAPRTPGSNGSADDRPKLVATDTINVRADQGTEHAVVGKIYRNETVSVLQDPDGEWVRITRGNVTGWVYRPLMRNP